MRLEHLLSRALVLVDLSTRWGKRRKEILETKIENLLLLLLVQIIQLSKRLRIYHRELLILYFKCLGIRNKRLWVVDFTSSCLVAQLVRVLH